MFNNFNVSTSELIIRIVNHYKNEFTSLQICACICQLAKIDIDNIGNGIICSLKRKVHNSIKKLNYKYKTVGRINYYEFEHKEESSKELRRL